ncbi:UvrD-like helicase ATP-binding domain-containing protein [Citrus sinensis]|uniref:UvrD-like helicase ATP-binding domain-containing protein n=1 Tax=Citrus sinensis TaxID=2711 RepID=A0ACB8INK4_CITSI|nr:UvrD-like helicase ATP-binding domain-containing protein [Citrus sinensis]
MMEGDASSSSKKKKAVPNDYGFIDTIFSWSLEDIFYQNLFKDKVEQIPLSFQSVNRYFESFVFPLLEETRAQLSSSMEKISEAPFAQVVDLEDSKPYGAMLSDVKVDYWRNRFSNYSKESYKVLPGDILVLADAKPETASDLRRVGRMWTFVSVTKVTEDKNESDTTSTSFKVKASKENQIDGANKSLFAIFLTNVTSNTRIWNSLHMSGNLKIIKELLCTDSVVKEDCELCPVQSDGIWNDIFGPSLSSTLNDSQAQAVLSCLRRTHCDHKATVELIWGPPGTGKTKTVSMLLVSLLQMKCGTLVCTPTNVAIMEVASRVVKLVKESVERDSSGTLFFPFGEILLFGNNERLKVDSGVEEIYLDYRIKRLEECLAPITGWRHCFASMIDFLDDCVFQYHIYMENESTKQSEDINGNEIKEKKCRKDAEVSKVEIETFLEFVRERFKCTAAPLRSCIFNLDNMGSEDLEELFSHSVDEDFSESIVDIKYMLHERRSKCHSVLRKLWNSFSRLNLPSAMNIGLLKDFCFTKASLIFCTASSSYKLHRVAMEQLQFLVIDEAAQLKEVESAIPLKLPGIQHAILIGDECQLPAMVESSVSGCLGRSLFERLSNLGQAKHLLSIQYRMHPSISSFPNSYFYDNKIFDSPNVKEKNYEKRFLPGRMYGPYSFINVLDGREESIAHSYRNMVEILSPTFILSTAARTTGVGITLLFLTRPAFTKNRSETPVVLPAVFPLSVFLSPSSSISLPFIAAPCLTFSVYPSSPLFRVVVASHGILTATLWANVGSRISHNGSGKSATTAILWDRVSAFWGTGTGSSPYSAQVVAIQEKLGSKFANSAGFAVKVMSIDGFKGGEEDIIIISTVRSNNGGLIGFLSNPKRVNVALTRARHCLWILGNARTLTRKKSVWEALVHDANARQCFFNAEDEEDLGKAILGVKKELDEFDDLLNPGSILFRSQRWKVNFSENFLKSFRKLTSDQTKKWVTHLLVKLSSGWRPKKRNVEIIKQFKVERFYIICTIDIVKESQYFQVLKVWDILPLEDVPKLVARLDNILAKYTDEFINHCKEKCIEGNLEVPKTWAATSKVVRFKNLADIDSDSESDLGGAASDSTSYVENSNVSDSLLLMKFYSLSSGAVSHLLSDRDGGELDLPFEVTDEQLEMILFPKSSFILGRSGTGKTTILTMKLFQKEKLHHMAMDGFYGVNNSVTLHSSWESGAEEGLGETERPILRQLFVTVSPKLCFAVKQHISQMISSAFGGKFVAESRLIDIDDAAEFKDIPNSFAAIPAESYPLVITFHKFLMMLDGTLGGLQSIDVADGKFCREDYIRLSETRVSTVLRSEREKIYEIYEKYEQMKMRNGEFDLADLVNDLHRRFKEERYKGDEFHFVYIDEVQDLTMSQIALFKYVCRNIEEGFVFSGDTAQTIARGIDFRFQDIRSLFYKKFVLESRNTRNVGRQEKGQLSKIFNLSQNFRTHAGVLNLAQSVIELFYRFFPHSVDILKPETSLIYGEPPILLESRNDENAIIKIFGNSGDAGGNMVGFGAEQVILVRDDCVRKEISNYVGKQALVLTIVESKGLEFQDVLLYDFFGSSPLKNQWRVVYEYMKEQALFDSTSPGSFPSFNEAKHNVLCSELKQLYVAITRTRQRLWIWENMEEFSKPMFDYWKKKSLVQVRQLDLAQAMQVASSPEEWKSRGIKLFHEHNYDMATICFEKAKDSYWEGRSKATGLKATADRCRSSNPKQANVNLREAAKIFEAIGKADSAAKCFYNLGEYERAGRIYLERCEEPELEKAGECFFLAGCYKLAADVYAKGKFFSECLAVCSKGKLFEIGLQYMNHWKQHADTDVGHARRSKEIYKTEQNFLQSCARHYHGLKDYQLAADAYARGNFFSECLVVCSEGKLFDIGLQYINYWKQHAETDVGLDERSKEMNKIEKDFLWICALHYHGLKDCKLAADMYARGKFFSECLAVCFEGKIIDIGLQYINDWKEHAGTDVGLLSLSCFDDLLVLEEESGNFMDAANIARLRGDIFLAVDLLQKAGCFKEACNVTLNHVISNSLWSPGSKGWPLKQFTKKKELLEKAKSLAKNESNQFYEFVCTEADILSNDQSDLSIINQQLNASMRHQSISGETLSVRQILDFHLKTDSSKYVWGDELVLDLTYSEEIICKNRVSVQSLVYFWDCWKDKIVNVIEYLGCLKSQDFSDHGSYGDFCLHYLGVWKQHSNLDTVYLLLNSDADWVRGLGNSYALWSWKLPSIDVHQLVSAGKNYWSSELLSVGMKVLYYLEALNKQSSTNSPSVFSQVLCLNCINEVAKFLLSSKHLNLSHHDAEILQKFVDRSTEHFFDSIFPLDRRESLKMNMITLKGTEFYRNIIKEVIFKHLKDSPSYGRIGSVMVMILGSGKLGNDVYERVAKWFDGNSLWKELFESLSWNMGSKSCQGSASCHNFDELKESHIQKFYKALVDIYGANWRKVHYITPASFLYLIERLLILLSRLNGYIFTTKSSFVDWFIYQEGSTNPTCSSSTDVKQSFGGVLEFIGTVVRQFLYNGKEVMEWIGKSHTNITHYHSLVVLRLVVIICLLHLNFGGDSLNLLLDLLGRSYICNKLPREFYDALRRRRNHSLLDVIAEAFIKICNPLVLASLGDNCPKFAGRDTIFVDMVTKSMEDILATLFPEIEASEGHAGAAKMKATDFV